MASYVPLGSYTTVKVSSPSVIQTIDVVSFATLPTGIFCEYGIDHTVFIAEGQGAANQPLIESLAGYIEDVVTEVPGVTGGTFVQDVDPSTGLLTDFVQFYVSYTSPTPGKGTFTTFVDVPVNNFFTANPGIGGFVPPATGTFTRPIDQVAQAYDSLKALAGD